MHPIAQSFTLRITLSFTLCVCLLLLPNVSLFVSEASQGQSAGHAARPRGYQPEGTWPNLESSAVTPSTIVLTVHTHGII